MKKIFYGFAAMAFLSLGMTACSDKDNEPDEGGMEIPDNGSGTMDTFTPEESKTFLENTATEAINMLNPNDQKEVIDLCGYFVETYGDLELPDNFYTEEDNYLTDYYKSTQKAFGSSNPFDLTRVAVEYVYDLNFNDYKGVYVPGTYAWVKEADSNDVIFKFTNAAGQECELKATGSSNSYETSFEWTEDYYYDEETFQYNFRVPNEVKLTLTANGTELVSATVVSNVNFEGHNFQVDANVTVANIKVAAQTSGNDSQVKETATVTVGGQSYLSSTGYLNGSHLFDMEYFNEYYNDYEDEEGKFNGMLNKDGEATVTLLNKLSIDGYYKWNQGLYDALDGWAETASEAQNYVDILNKSITANIRYNNTTTVQANLLWDYQVEEYYGYTDYYLYPVIKFLSDGSTYSLEEYFDNGFNGVESAFNSLVKKYQAVIDAAF